MNPIRSLVFAVTLTAFSVPTWSQQPVYVQEKSGYNTTTQVSNQRSYFVQFRFTPDTFSGWTKLAIEAKANDAYNQMIQDGKVSKKGVATGPIVYLGQPFPAHVGLRASDLIPFTPPPVDIFSTLVQYGILSKDGYLNGVSANVTTEFYKIDFGFLQQKLSTLPIGIVQSSADFALKTELFNLIVGYHRGLETTVVETTRYQSRNDNMFNNLIETIGGNFLASVFTPDRAKVNNQQMAYSPNLDVDSLYNRQYGFTQTPYEDHRSGVWALNGKNSRTPMTIGGAQYNKGSQLFGTLSLQNRVPLVVDSRGAFQFTDFSGTYSVSDRYAEKTQYLAVGVGVGTGQSNWTWRTGFNVGYVKAPATDGLAYGGSLESDWYPINPFSVSVKGSILVNPNVSTDGRLSLGIGMSLFGGTALVSYDIQTLGPNHNVVTTEGWGLSLSVGL